MQLHRSLILKQSNYERNKTMNYNEILQTVKTVLTDNHKTKADVQSVRFATGYYAVSFCHAFSEWAEYDALFSRLKADLKKEGLKFAGSPLAKACLVTATAVIDCRVSIAGDNEESRFETFKELLKENSLNFSSKQGDVRLALGIPTESDLESAKVEILKKIDKAIDYLVENVRFLTAENKATLVTLLSEQAEKAS